MTRRYSTIPPGELREHYENQGKSFEACAEHFGCSSSLIEIRLHEYGIPTRPPGSEPVDISESDLRRWYVELGLSTVDIAEEVGCHNSTISRRLREFGIPTDGPNHGNSLNIPNKEIITLYVEEEHTTYELADRYDCDPTVIERRLRWFGIETRHTTAGDGEWQYKYGSTWRRQRRSALDRADHRCERCGITDAEHRETHVDQTRGVGVGLDVHHRVSVRLFRRWDRPIDDANGLSNLMVLCQACHHRYGDRAGTY